MNYLYLYDSFELVILMKISEIDINDRPREKIINDGPEKLSEIELLAIMLGSGTKNESIMDLSKRLINDYGLERLFRMNYEELKKISGIKMAKASKLIATFEIARRILKNKVMDKELKYSKDVFEYVRGDYSFLEYELLTVILVNSKLRIIKKEVFSDHNYDSISFPIKDIIKIAIDNNAYGIFIVHNHPTGNVNPSVKDIETTHELMRLCKTLGIHFFDHLIIGGDKYFSFSESNI